MAQKIGIERIEELQRQGIFGGYTKLVGLEEIGYVLHWSRNKLKSRLEELQDAGVIFRDRIGSPPVIMWCSYVTLVQIWSCLKGQKREIL